MHKTIVPFETLVSWTLFVVPNKYLLDLITNKRNALPAFLRWQTGNPYCMKRAQNYLLFILLLDIQACAYSY